MLVTNHIGAARLVEANEAVEQDFYTTYGICNWEPGQLRDEVDRGRRPTSVALGVRVVCPVRRFDLEMVEVMRLIWLAAYAGRAGDE